MCDLDIGDIERSPPMMTSGMQNQHQTIDILRLSIANRQPECVRLTS
jgi:hypothetical protein